MLILIFGWNMLLSAVIGAKDVDLHYSFVTNKSSQQTGGAGREQTEAYVQESTVIHSYTNGQSYTKEGGVAASAGGTESLIVTVGGQKVSGHLRFEGLVLIQI